MESPPAIRRDPTDLSASNHTRAKKIKWQDYLVVPQFEITPEALANFSPRLERSDNLGIANEIGY